MILSIFRRNLNLYFRLKYNERLLHDQELRTLRQQAKITDDYRIIIAKQEAEILVRISGFFFIINKFREDKKKKIN